MTEPQSRPGDKRWQIVNYIGIADQLLVTAANRVLAAHDLPLAQFIMLNHFSHEPARGRTVTGITAAFQAPQPGITKMLQRLVAKRLLAVRASPGDGRVKLHYLTAKGAAVHGATLAALMPMIGRVFEDWPAEDVERLHGLLFRLKTWLDADREGAPADTEPRAAAAGA